MIGHLSFRTPLHIRRLSADRFWWPDDEMEILAHQGMAYRTPDGALFPCASYWQLISLISAADEGDDPVSCQLRSYAVIRAKALGYSNEIPSTWNSDCTVDRSGDRALRH